MKKLAQFFFRGLLVVLPVAITAYLFIISVRWVDSLVQIKIPGVGLLIVLGTITAIGMMTSFFVTKQLFELVEKMLGKLPFINILYTSVKDLIGAFVGDKRKFDHPVLVTLNSADAIYKIGFITEKDLSRLNLEAFVSVYLPHSYNFSGNHFIVHVKNIKQLDISGADAMKYVVSGGVSRN